MINTHNSSQDWSNFLQIEKSVLHSFYEIIGRFDQSDAELADIFKIGLVKHIDIANFIWLNSKVESSRNNPVKFSIYYNIPKELSRFQRIKLQVKSIVITLIANIVTCTFRGEEIAIVLDSFNKDSLPYLLKNKFRIREVIYLKTKRFKFIKLEERIEVVCKDLIDDIKRKNFRLGVDDEQWCEVLIDLKLYLQHIHGLYTSLKGKKIVNIVVGANNKLETRTFSAVVLREKGRVIGCTHGENLCYLWEKLIWMDLILCSDFLERNKMLINDIIECVLESKFPLEVRCRFHSLEDKWKFEGAHRIDFDFEQRHALVVGNVFRDSGLSSVTSYGSEEQLYWELSVIKYLKNKGCIVSYKPHPGVRLCEWKYVEILKEIDNLCDHIEHEVFERIIDNYDICAFYYSRTTTINSAIETENLDLIYFDLGYEQFASFSNNFIKSNFKVIGKHELKSNGN